MNKNGNTLAIIGITLLVIFVFIMMIFFWVMGSYNGLVAQDEQTRQYWGNVQTAYQRRADLIPNLVETVKGAKNFEQETLTKIAELRSQAGQAQTKVNTATTPEQLSAANSEMSGVLSRLMVIVEAYPELKSNQNFLALQDELAGSENRVKWERDKYNEEVAKYGIKVRSFPTNVVAGMFGFSYDKWKTFSADPGADKVPQVSFE